MHWEALLIILLDVVLGSLSQLPVLSGSDIRAPTPIVTEFLCVVGGGGGA